jgi:4-amino-4-deoxy-L-arabinose transferase-like glycosyltransferase
MSEPTKSQWGHNRRTSAASKRRDIQAPVPKYFATALPWLMLVTVTLGGLVPFLGKAFHIDDPLFVWCARHIQANPFDFYGFHLNWVGYTKSMAAVTQNPPLCSYYIALVGWLLGWSEIALHTGFLLPALAVVLGTYYLARNFCSHPVWAALVVATAPVFVLCGTSVMSDIMMLAFWVWALFFWIEGLKEGKQTKLCLAALFIAGAGLTKYFGLSLIPLLGVYSWLERRKIGWWLVCLLLPLLPITFYQWLTCHLYGHNLLVNAVIYATTTRLRVGGDLLSKFLAGFAFVGGCIVILLTAAPYLWGWRRLMLGLPSMALVGLLIKMWQEAGVFPVVVTGNVNWIFVAQMSLWVVVGASLLILMGADVMESKTPATTLLLLWIAGTFLFTCVVNWTVSGRNILPMLPAVSLLLIRRLEKQGHFTAGGGWRRLAGSLAISLVIALLVTLADYKLANSSRTAASVLTQKLATTAGTVKFEGHWGFQYYIEKSGASPLDRFNPQLSPNEAVVVPVSNSYLFPLPEDRVAPWFKYEPNTLSWLATMSGGAGFYSDGWGPLPFIFCAVPAEKYLVYRVK